MPGSPVLGASEAAAIRADPQALAGFRTGLDRMTRFYAENDVWLTGFGHNHLRITRIITATRALPGRAEAERFHRALLLRNAAAGSPVNRDSLRFWGQALGR